MALVKAHVTEVEKIGPVGAHILVAQFTARLTKEGKGVVQFGMSSLMEPVAKFKVEIAIHTLLMSEIFKCEHKSGTAPATQGERALQEAVDKMKELLKK